MEIKDLSTLRKSKRTINRIIVHCSATQEGKDFTAADIDRWHRQRGFDCIGYHYVIYRDGTIHEGRSVDRIGAHCTGYNSHSIGVCYIGGLDKDGKTAKDTRTDKQKASMYALLKRLKELHKGASINGHRDFSSKACPSFNATKEYKNL